MQESEDQCGMVQDNAGGRFMLFLLKIFKSYDIVFFFNVQINPGTDMQVLTFDYEYQVIKES